MANGFKVERADDHGKPFCITHAGQEFVTQDQRHTVIEIRPVDRRDGAKTEIAEMESACVVCGKAFRYTTALAGDVFYPTRRCKAHKARGQRVGALETRAQKDKRRLEEQIEKQKEVIAGLREARDAARLKAQEEKVRANELARALARYELTPGEASAFGERCAAATKERRARVKKLRAMRAPAPSPFG